LLIIVLKCGATVTIKGAYVRFFAQSSRADAAVRIIIRKKPDFSKLPGYSCNESELKLRIELVPSPLWRLNLRSRLTRSKWKRLRERILQKEGLKCSVRGREAESKDLNCDEIWDYDDKHHMAKLIGLRVVCRMCHLVKHFGKAGLLALEGDINSDDLIEHFMSVNGCNFDTFQKHSEEAFQLFAERSKHQWTIDYGEFAALVRG